MTTSRTANSTSEELNAGEEGGLLVRGDSVMPGYWEAPELTDDAFSTDADGRRWFHTGDVVVEDQDGYLAFVDRADDIVLTGGEKVAPSRVEAVVAEMDGVSAVAVVGTPHDRLGEQVTATVVGDVTPEDVRAHCEASEALAGYEEPRRVEVLDELPRTGSRTVDRTALHDRLVEER